ncbi:MAG: hypothetical protein ACNA8S_16605 [Deferrisomatales bacterium]
MQTTTRAAAIATIATIANAATALAATGTRVDHSGIFVWAFLGFCALIVAAQVVPAILMAVGAVKGAAAGIREHQATRIPVR